MHGLPPSATHDRLFHQQQRPHLTKGRFKTWQNMDLLAQSPFQKTGEAEWSDDKTTAEWPPRAQINLTFHIPRYSKQSQVSSEKVSAGITELSEPSVKGLAKGDTSNVLVSQWHQRQSPCHKRIELCSILYQLNFFANGWKGVPWPRSSS